MARAPSIQRQHRFANILESHAGGICAYARFELTTARVEAGNVAIGMIRKRARSILDTDFFKLKIRQSTTPEPPPCSSFPWHDIYLMLLYKSHTTFSEINWEQP